MLKIRRTLAASLKGVLLKEGGRFSAMEGARVCPPEDGKTPILEATNGKTLLQVPLEVVPEEEIPVDIPEEHRVPDPIMGGVLTPEALGALKGSGSKASDPYSFFALLPLQNRVEAYCSAKASGSGATLASELPGAYRGSYRLHDGEFPQTGAVLRAVEERKASGTETTVCLDIQYLQGLLTALQGAGAENARIMVGKPEHPVLLEGFTAENRSGPLEEIARGIIMPMIFDR